MRQLQIDERQIGLLGSREQPRFFELVTEVRERLRAGGADTAEPTPEEELIVAEENL